MSCNCLNYASLIDRYQSSVSQTEFSVIMHIARSMERSAARWVRSTIDSIAYGTGLSVRTVAGVLSRLRYRQILAVELHPRGANAYSLPAVTHGEATAKPAAAATQATAAVQAAPTMQRLPAALNNHARASGERESIYNQSLSPVQEAVPVRDQQTANFAAQAQAAPSPSAPSSPPRPAPSAAPTPAPEQSELRAIDVVLDDMFTCKVSRVNRRADFAQSLWNIAGRFGRNGAQVATVLQEAWERVKYLPSKPYSWNWCVAVVTNALSREDAPGGYSTQQQYRMQTAYASAYDTPVDREPEPSKEEQHAIWQRTKAYMEAIRKRQYAQTLDRTADCEVAHAV